MKLPEVLGALLKAEDEASAMRHEAEQEAKAIIEKARAAFALDQEARLKAAREAARSQVEAARHAAEMDALHIADLARKSREKMQEHFDKKAPELVARIAEEFASRYAAQGRR